MKVDIKINTTSIERKFSKANITRGRQALASQMLPDMAPYVPMRKGTLRGSAHIGNNGGSIYWQTPYARRRFYEENVNFTTAGTGARWDKVAKANHIDSWKRALGKGMGFN